MDNINYSIALYEYFKLKSNQFKWLTTSLLKSHARLCNVKYLCASKQCLSIANARNAVSITCSQSLRHACSFIFSINAGKNLGYNTIALFNCSTPDKNEPFFSSTFALPRITSGSLLTNFKWLYLDLISWMLIKTK